MDALQRSLYKTIVYFDMFDFSPTLTEIARWLLKEEDSQKNYSLFEIRHKIEHHERIQHKNGFYFLRNREQLVELRQRKYDFTEEKWKHAKRFIRLLAMMPQVKAIWFANAMGWGNAHQKSDIDLCIVTTPKKIWTARFFTTLLLKLLHQRPGEQDPRYAICLSFYVCQDHLNLEPYKIGYNDIHFAFWVNQVYPVYDATSQNPNDGIFQQYQRANQWLSNVFHTVQWTRSSRRFFIRQTSIEKILKRGLELLPLEQLLKKIQRIIMPKRLKTMANTTTCVVINDQILKLHDNDPREEFQKKFDKHLCQTS